LWHRPWVWECQMMRATSAMNTAMMTIQVPAPLHYYCCGKMHCKPGYQVGLYGTISDTCSLQHEAAGQSNSLVLSMTCGKNNTQGTELCWWKTWESCIRMPPTVHGGGAQATNSTLLWHLYHRLYAARPLPPAALGKFLISFVSPHSSASPSTKARFSRSPALCFLTFWESHVLSSNWT